MAQKDAMKKTKHTPIPLPGSQSKLSTEFIDSGDDSAPEVAPLTAREKLAKHKALKAKQAAVTIAVHRPKTNTVAKKAEAPAAPASKAKKAEKAVSDSEPSSSEVSSDDTSSAEESSDEEALSSKKPQKASKAPKASKSQKEPEKAASSSSSSEESEDEAAPAPAPAAQAPVQPSQPHRVEFRPAQAFVPPKGFAAIPAPLNSSSQAAKLFENLDGKQIWHITAPAGVSISQLKEVALDKALAGSPVLTHKGIDYGFATRDKCEENARAVLLPGKKGYKAAPTQITQTLHLQQVVRLPNLEHTEQTAEPAVLSITKSSIRAPRPQLKGLRMRYFHSGFGDQEPGTLGYSDSETEAPVASGAHKKAGKRKHEAAELDSPAKKHKKTKTPEEIARREQKKAKRTKEKSNAKA